MTLGVKPKSETDLPEASGYRHLHNPSGCSKCLTRVKPKSLRDSEGGDSQTEVESTAALSGADPRLSAPAHGTSTSSVTLGRVHSPTLPQQPGLGVVMA